MRRTKRDDQRGFILIMLAGGLFLLICIMAGLAIDVGRGYVAKAELQSAADAAALAGVAKIYPFYNNSPYWIAAENEATNFVKASKVDGNKLQSATVESGFWNYSTSTFTLRTGTPSAGDAFAVRVTIQKSSTNDNGAVPAVFARVSGWAGFEPAASSVAAFSQPTQFFPIAISKCLFDQAKSGTGPANVTLTDSTIGVWTSLNGYNPSASMLKDYIQYLENPATSKLESVPSVKSPDPINVGTNGDMQAVYMEVANLIAAGKTRFKIPYVQCPIPTSGTTKVLGVVEVELKPDSTGSNILGRLFPVQLAK